MMTWVSICIKWLSHSKWPSEWSKESASNFAVTLNIPLWKPFWWFRRPQLWATGDWQLHHDNVCSHASRLVQSSLAKHHITQVTQPLYSPDLVPCDFWLFPFKRTEISDPQWDSGKYDRASDGNQENCVRSQGVYFEGDWSVIVLCTVFLVPYLLQ